MRRTSTLVCFVLCSTSFAQSWCAPGAEWTYSFANQQAYGVTRAWYSGDTLLGGYDAQRLDQTILAYQPTPPFGQPFTQVLTPLFTRYDDGVVHLWDASNNSYDTLIWFSANPGDHWQFPHQGDWVHFDVLDTGTSVVDGIPLRYLVVEEPIAMGVIDTVRERIGFDYFYIDPMETLLIDWTTGWLHCYRDDDIDEFHGSTWAGVCDFTVTVPEVTEVSALPYPNPGTEHFTLQLPSGEHSIEVFDAIGRKMISERTTDVNVRIGTTELLPGIYHVRVAGAQGTIAHNTWVKQ